MTWILSQAETEAPMHELSLAQNIVEIVDRHVPEEQRGSVRSVRLKIGELSGVVADSLDFCFSAIVGETLLKSARLNIENVPFVVRCQVCDKSFAGEFGIVRCPTCGGSETEVVSGTEMQIVDIELCDQGSE